MSGDSPLRVSSEIYDESSFSSVQTLPNANSLVDLKFLRPSGGSAGAGPLVIDDDGDLLVRRKPYDTIKLEFSSSTTLPLVGLQLWKGALLLADFILSEPCLFQGKTILELGSGVGFTGIVAGTMAKKVFCTDMDSGDILDLIRRNVERNASLTAAEVSVYPLDFRKKLSEGLKTIVNSVDIVIAADVIYDNDLTEDFVKCLTSILAIPPKKLFFLAIEKRYVFTIQDLETSAPCYDYFKKFLRSYWRSKEAPEEASSWIVSPINPMDGKLEEAKTRREELISNHRIKLKTPAIYALEVHITTVVIDPKFNKTLTDLPEDVEPRFKFMSFPSVKLSVRGPEDDTPEGDITQDAVEPAEPEPNEPRTEEVETGDKSTAKTPQIYSSPGNDGDSDKPINANAALDEEAVKEDETEGDKAEENVCCQRINCDPNKIKDPNYFDPTRLLKKPSEEQGGEKAQRERSNPERSKPDQLRSSSNDANATAASDNSPQPTSEATKPNEAAKSPASGLPEQPSIFINDNKTMIFCMQPFELLNGLRRYPLTVSLTRPKRRSVIGYSFLYILPLIDAVDKSVSLTQSVPICGLMSGSFDLTRCDEIIGHFDSDEQFQRRFSRDIALLDNPNVKGEASTSDDMPKNQLSAANKGNPLNQRNGSNEKVMRDINTLPPIISGDEFLPQMPSNYDKILTTAEIEEKEKERQEIELQTRFPQYKCLPSWEVVFNRRVLKDLIAKNRRPFKQGSADRMYVEKYFSELLPENKSISRKFKKTQADCTKSNLQVQALDLAEDWWASDANAFSRKKKPGTRREDAVGAPSTTSIAHNLVGRNVKQMQSSAWSRVALFKFDPDNDDDIRDSRFQIVEPHSVPNTSYPVNGGKKHDVFVVRAPRLDGIEEGSHPVPERPLAFAMNLPWKTAPHDVINEVRRAGAEVDAIGGDTKDFFRKPKEEILLPKSKLPDHLDEMSRGGKTMPLTTPVVNLEIERGVPVAVPVRSTPYWEGHAPMCSTPTGCNHFVLLHPGYGFYGISN